MLFRVLLCCLQKLLKCKGNEKEEEICLNVNDLFVLQILEIKKR
jgi:hypothetical protein